jgi:prevent-host-death family protein
MSVSVSQFKAKLGRYMRAVRAGREVTITDRGAPVARLVGTAPHETHTDIVIAQARDAAAPPLGALDVRPIRRAGTDTGAMLREDRGRR